ncbi:MAG: SUMO ligase siz1 [Alectoria fallacina]|uniref:SUMO ligase siz1 n=1 Tax=Alectoria fallacina TaxID=1903189 RepID=A0A8H3J9W7_9LECA|nr:MAG: SUMO ligase siz1 [Alectoria fallacina]
MASAGALNPETVSAKVKTLMNNQLKTILKKESLPVSGAKAAMQSRVINKLYSYGNNNDIEGFSRLRSLVNNPDLDPAGLSPSPSTARMYPNNSTSAPNHYQHSFSSSTRPGSHNTAPNVNGTGPRPPQFKASPFFSILEPLSPLLDCKVRDQTRDTVNLVISLRTDIAERLSADSSTRAMIYCASDPMSPFSKVDIEFPYQLEIKINQDEVKSNFRGLKNKPGTTRPADITTMLRPKSGYDNHMEVTYALTKKRFLMVVNLVKRHLVEELVAKLKSGKTIVKEQVVREMISKSEDAEIVATSSIMSLKCPLSTLRIDVPCRSSVCSHNQCFDASSFLQLQEQAPTWTCPVCNKAATYEHLQVDQYVAEILKSTPMSVDQVTIEPNGRWSQTTGCSPSPRTSNGRNSNDGEEDLVEIRDLPRLASVKLEVSREPGFMRTPPISSREQSTSSAPLPPSSIKRSAGQVVDLTLSSDEDEDPPRGPKRQQLVHKSSSSLARLPGLEKVPLRTNGANGGMARQPSSNPFATPNHTPKEYTQPR